MSDIDLKTQELSDIDLKTRELSRLLEIIKTKVLKRFDDIYCYNYLYVLKYILMIYDYELLQSKLIITKYLFKSLFNKILDEIRNYQIDKSNYNEYDEDTGELIRDKIKDNYYIAQYYIEFINPSIIDETLEILNSFNSGSE